MKAVKKWFWFGLVLAGLALFAFVHLQKVLKPPRVFRTAFETAQAPKLSELRFEFQDVSVLSEWREHVSNGKTLYEIKPSESGEAALRAESRGASSALLHAVEIPIASRPVLSWEWKAARFPSKKLNQVFAAKEDNDYAARIYVAFEALSPLTADLIQYVWDDYFPEGTTGTSPYSSRVKIMVVEHGLANPGGWVRETRDIARDYETLFGKPPSRNVAVIGLMSDSDNTGTESEAFYREISIQSAPAAPVIESVSKTNGIFSWFGQWLPWRRLQFLKIDWLVERS